MRAVSVSVVKEDGYALQAGIEAGDLILKINGHPINSPQQVTDSIADGPAIFSIIRDIDQFDITVDSPTLGVILGEVEFDEIKFANDRAIARIVISTAQSIPGKQITGTLDVVGAQCIYGVNVLADLAAGVRDLVGGRSTGLQKKIAEARRQVMRDLREEAHRLGANGIIAATFEHAEIGDKGGFMLMVTATGTAVVCD